MRQHDEFDPIPAAIPDNDPIIRREQRLPVARDAAWPMLGTAAGLAAWLADEVDLDVHVGAEGVIRWDDGEERRTRVEEVTEGRRLVLIWSAPGGPPSLVELTLEDDAVASGDVGADGAGEGDDADVFAANDDALGGAAQGSRLVIVEVPISVLRAVSTVAIADAGDAGGADDGGAGGWTPGAGGHAGGAPAAAARAPRMAVACG